MCYSNFLEFDRMVRSGVIGVQPYAQNPIYGR